MGFWEYVAYNYKEILSLAIEHIKLTAVSVGLAVLIGVPLGILIAYVSKASKPVLLVANIIQAVPSMALLGFMIPFLGIGTIPAVVAVVLYSLLPIIKNTYTGIININPQTLEAAKGIGLTPFQVLRKVQIPLALPVIMAGVRIASVTAVGLMTMAAFIGAGGLGQLVFSGIRAISNTQILAGAIPACILALLVDFLLGLVEKLVTPVSLQKGNIQANKKVRTLQKSILAVFVVAIAILFAVTSFDFTPKGGKVIRVASKDYSEQTILGHMVSDLIEAETDITVDRKKVDLGGTQICYEAIKKGEIDMYIEYSGTAYTDILKHDPISDVDKVYDTVKKEYKEKLGIDVLKQMGFNNTFALAIRPDTAEKYNIKTISDFAKVAPSLKAGITYEFSNRKDGMPGLQNAYGFTMPDVTTLDAAPRYIALDTKDVDVVDAYATDGLLKKFGLLTLEDDLQFFPPYYAIPIVRSEVLKEVPEIVPLLEKLGEILDDDIMRELNYKVDELQLSPAQVAKEFLQEQGLI